MKIYSGVLFSSGVSVCNCNKSILSSCGALKLFESWSPGGDLCQANFIKFTSLLLALVESGMIFKHIKFQNNMNL